MKKLIVVLMAMAVVASADGFVVGTELNYGKVDSELTASTATATASASDDTKTLGITFKAGYQFDDLQLFGTVSTEKYSDELITNNEGNAVALGLEADYAFNDMFIGGTIAQGSKDFDGTDIDFTDIGIRCGLSNSVDDNSDIQIGLYYKKRDYDSYTESGITLDLNDDIVGLFLGMSFSL